MNTVFTSAVNVLGYDVAPLAPTGAVHQTTDGLGDDIVVSLNDSLLSDSSLRKYHTAAGAIAMAKIATDMILLGREGKTWTLLMDAATMCAGNQYQAILASFPDRSALLAADGSTLHFKRVVLGNIPMVNGTYGHRCDRIMEMLEELVSALQDIPHFGINHADA